MLHVTSVSHMHTCTCMCGSSEIYKVVKYILQNLFKKDRRWTNPNPRMKPSDIVINLVLEKVHV